MNDTGRIWQENANVGVFSRWQNKLERHELDETPNTSNWSNQPMSVIMNNLVECDEGRWFRPKDAKCNNAWFAKLVLEQAGNTHGVILAHGV